MGRSRPERCRRTRLRMAGSRRRTVRRRAQRRARLSRHVQLWSGNSPRWPDGAPSRFNARLALYGTPARGPFGGTAPDGPSASSLSWAGKRPLRPVLALLTDWSAPTCEGRDTERAGVASASSGGRVPRGVRDGGAFADPRHRPPASVAPGAAPRRCRTCRRRGCAPAPDRR